MIITSKYITNYFQIVVIHKTNTCIVIEHIHIHNLHIRRNIQMCISYLGNTIVFKYVDDMW
jgi:hypothetical protein